MAWCLVCRPSRPDPCTSKCVLSPLLFPGCLFGIVDAVLSSCLFLSGAGETQTPVWGFGVPLVFFHPGHALRLQSVPLAPHLHLGHAPATVFFFRRRRSRVWWFVSVCLWGVGMVGCFGFGGSLHALLLHLSEKRGSQTIIWRPNYHHDCVLGYECGPASRGSSESPSGLHSPHPLPAECCKGQPRKGVGEDDTRQPYCHTM